MTYRNIILPFIKDNLFEFFILFLVFLEIVFFIISFVIGFVLIGFTLFCCFIALLDMLYFGER